MGVTAPRLTSAARMRPTVETLARKPSRRSTTAILRLPHIGLSARAASTAQANSADHCGPRTRCGRRLFGSASFSQR
jgi:hypothetical protein